MTRRSPVGSTASTSPSPGDVLGSDQEVMPGGIAGQGRRVVGEGDVLPGASLIADPDLEVPVARRCRTR